MIFLFDENVPARFARALDALEGVGGVRVKHLADDLKYHGVPDVDWLVRLPKEERWAILTYDFHIQRRAAERQAWKMAGHVMFFLAPQWMKASFDDYAWMLVRKWPSIRATGLNASEGQGFRVLFGGSPKVPEAL